MPGSPVDANRLRPKADFGGQEASPGLRYRSAEALGEGGSPGMTNPHADKEDFDLTE